MTVEEMDAHLEYLRTFHKKLDEDLITEITEELAATKDPFMREWLTRRIEEIQARLARE